MKKQQLNIERPNYDSYEYALPIGEADIHVRLRISRREKEDAAAEMVVGTLIFDDDLGICHDAINGDVMRFLAALRHYTDIDVDAVEDVYALYDMFKASALYEDFMTLIVEDWSDTYEVYRELYRIAATVFTREHSLAHRAGKFLEDFLAVGDLTKTAAQAQDINNTLVEAFGALRAQQRMPDKLGGNILSFAKKEPDRNN